MSDWIERLFPGLRDTDYQITSPPDDVYNCLAWAAGEAQLYWWPGDPESSYWPDGAPLDESLRAFEVAFATLGYFACATEELEIGFEKVALFADEHGLPKHAARQLPNGRWTSKLGLLEDIEHNLRSLEGAEYGTVALLLKRVVPTAA